MGGSDMRSSKRPQFDLSSQDGVLQALYAVRTSELGAAERNALRDQLFLLSRTGDTHLREQLQNKLADVPLSEAFLETTNQRQYAQAAEATHSGFARGRRTPKFTVRQQPHTPVTPPGSDHSANEVDEVSAPAADSASAPVAAVTNSARTTPAPEVESVVPEATSSVTPPDATAVDVVASEPTQSAVATPVENVAVSAAEPSQSEVESFPPTLDRIREIKRYVNERIGNPVNLVDLDNELGRSYMTALLAAMQSVNNETGRAGTAEMQTLEQIFVSVQHLLLTSTAEREPATPSPAPEVDFPPVTPEPAVASNNVDSADVAAPKVVVPTTEEQPLATESGGPAEADDRAQNHVSQPVVAEESPISASEQVSAPTEEVTRMEEGMAASAAATELSRTPDSPEVPEETVPVPDSASVSNPIPIRQVAPAEESQPPTVPPDQEMDVAASPPPSVVSSPVSIPSTPVAPVTPPSASMAADASHNIDNKLHQLDAAAAARNQYDGDPLYASEIDMGLEQLLQEWSLFKSSGLFGTGPNGREHPLFKKLAPIMVNDILLGKFDGSRPEIIQSVTDYMNGWRYEQGIVYQPGETFETYLRRVIRFIIDSKA